jgi:uncharacterized membrane protein YdbT with pleckstrin-like domain
MTATTTETDGDASRPTDYEVPEWLSLDDDEEIEWAGEPVPISIVGTAVWGVILTVVLIGLLILLTLPFAWLSIKNTDYVVTNKALYVKTGVMSTNIESVGLDKIQNTEYSQSFWGKQFDYGTIDVSTAGSSGAEISFQNIGGASEVRERISRLSSEFGASGRRDRAADDDAAGTAGTASAEGMDELLEELRATREAMERVEGHLRAAPERSPSPAEQGAGEDPGE